MLTIRQATVADAELLCRLNAPVQAMHAEARPEVFKPPSTGEEMIDYFRTRLSSESVHAFLAEVEDEAIGYILAELIERPENPYCYPARWMLVDQMSVSPEHRDKGHGSALMRRVKEHARSLGVARLSLNVWAFNERAIAFYERQGFVVRDLKMEIALEA